MPKSGRESKRSKSHLTVVPDQPTPEPFPPHLRPVAQAAWDILTSSNIQASQEARLELADRQVQSATITLDEKKLVWEALMVELTKQTPSPPSSTHFGSRLSTTSGSTSPPRTSSSTSPSEPAEPDKVLWQPSPDFNWIAPDDIPSFYQETSKRMIILINHELENLRELRRSLQDQPGVEEHRMMVDKKISLMNILRIECIEMNLSSLPDDDLVVPDNQLVDKSGRPITPA